MDERDRRILNAIQEEFPVAAEPFQCLAERLGCSPEDVFSRVRAMKEIGVIRRIGAVFDLKRLGFVSTLCAARVPDDRVADFVAQVNGYRGVTHNYRRDHAYNIWFTFIAPSEAFLTQALAEIRVRTGIADILCLRAHRQFKINASFEF